MIMAVFRYVTHLSPVAAVTVIAAVADVFVLVGLSSLLSVAIKWRIPWSVERIMNCSILGFCNGNKFAAMGRLCVLAAIDSRRRRMYILQS